jgi:hypothetical protein
MLGKTILSMFHVWLRVNQRFIIACGIPLLMPIVSCVDGVTVHEMMGNNYLVAKTTTFVNKI